MIPKGLNRDLFLSACADFRADKADFFQHFKKGFPLKNETLLITDSHVFSHDRNILDILDFRAVEEIQLARPGFILKALAMAAAIDSALLANFITLSKVFLVGTLESFAPFPAIGSLVRIERI